MCCHWTDDLSEDEKFSADALAAARRYNRKRPWADGDTLGFYSFRVFPKISENRDVQVRYWVMRLDGQSHNMAEILALRKFPATRTDVEFNAGRVNGNQFEDCPGRGEWLRQVAEAQGVSVTGKTYIGGLADYPGDPTAWVSGKGDVLRVAREKNLTVRGQVEYQGHEVEPMGDITVAPDIIDREVASDFDRNPFLDREARREELVSLRSGAVDPHEPLVQHTDVNYF